MKHLKNTFKQLWNDESAQGMTEYILLLVVVVAIIALFKKQIGDKVSGLIDTLKSKMDEVTQ